MDKHYTPLDLARNIVSRLKIREPRSVADFAVGDASLIEAVRERWPHVFAYGTDIDPEAIERVSARLANLESDVCDFLSSDARAASGLLTGLEEAIDLIFINPPFSCRGSSRVDARIGDEAVRCSVAMAFLGTTLTYVSSRGVIVAILPSSCLTSEKDAPARRALNRFYKLEVLGEGHVNQFANCSVHTVFVVLKRRLQARRLRVVRTNAPEDPRWLVTRGNLPAATVCKDPGSPPFVHSTELIDGKVELIRGGLAGRGYVVGPAILIPRVGRPRASKVCWLEAGTQIVLSDCVISIQSKNLIELQNLKAWLIENWTLVESRFVGSCAKYITLQILGEVLAQVPALELPNTAKASTASSGKASPGTLFGTAALGHGDKTSGQGFA
jgi:predicted RNA methylase